jgi:chromate transporter
MPARHPSGPSPRIPLLLVLRVFLHLGLTSFGGPIAHLGYYRREFVERHRWLNEDQFAQLIALTQFLPGPSSSQLGFAVGLLQAGWRGALIACLAFTLPSALLLLGFAALVGTLSSPLALAALHGLKLVALAVVAHGVLQMARALCPDPVRATIASMVAVVILVTGPAWVQLLVVALGGLAGWWWCRDVATVQAGDLPWRHGPRSGWVLLAVFAALLAGLPLASRLLGDEAGLLGLVDAFYRAGSLVFGGGHVVLPLLEEAVVGPGWLSDDQFLSGYGAAQAVPGPLFALSAYLGALVPASVSGGVAIGAAAALVAIFLPGFLLVAGVLPLWRQLAGRPGASRAIAGVNAAVVGLLGAALYDPVFTSAVRGPADLAVALIGFTLLQAWRASALAVVAWCVIGSVLVYLL